MRYISLMPSYGRDYRSARFVKQDFEADKDFIIADMSNRWNGKPINKSQLVLEAPMTVKIRFNKLAKFTQIVLKGDSK